MNREMARREFLAVGLASATGLALPRPAPAQAGSLRGSELIIFRQVWSIPEGEKVLAEAEKKWGAANGVKVSVLSLESAQHSTQLAAMAETKQGADIVVMHLQHLAIQADILVDVTDLASELGRRLGGWYEAPGTIAIRNGRWKAVPSHIWGQYWHYRTDLFKAAGADKFPETWEEMRSVGRKLKEKGTPIGFALGHGPTDGNAHAYSLLWSFGGKEFEADGRTVALDSPETVRCVDWFKGFWKEACDEGAIAWGEPGNNQAYNSRQVCATNNANTIYIGALKNDPDLAKVTSIAAAPKGPAGAYQFQQMVFLGIPTYAKNPQAARAFLRDSYFTLEFQRDFVKSGSGYNLPAFGALERDDAAWPSDPKLAAARQLGKLTRLPGYAGSFTAKVGQVMDKFIIVDMFAKAVQGMSAQDTVKWAVNEMQLTLKG